MYTYANKTKKRSKKKWIIPIVLVLVLAAGSFVWFRHSRSGPKVTQSQVGTATSDPNVPGPGSTSDTGSTDTTGNISNSKDSDSNEVGSTPSSNVQPSKPTGNFVSAHQNVPLTAPMNSTCNTSAGVMCIIRFTSGSKVKELPAQKTNGNGSTSWDWTPKQYGLTVGTWSVTAIATNGDKMASATDATPLVIN